MLKNVFDMENPVMRGLAAVFDLMLLNILALLAALPVVTAGASLTALHEVSQRLVRGEDVYVGRRFYRSFRENLKKGSVLGLVFLAAVLVIVVDYHLSKTMIPPLRFFFAAAALFLLALSFYAFALQARFENTIGQTLKNAAWMMVGYFPRTFAMLAFTLAFYLILFRAYRVGVPVLMMFGISLPVYISAYLYAPVFQKIEQGKAE